MAIKGQTDRDQYETARQALIARLRGAVNVMATANASNPEVGAPIKAFLGVTKGCGDGELYYFGDGTFDGLQSYSGTAEADAIVEELATDYPMFVGDTELMSLVYECAVLRTTNPKLKMDGFYLWGAECWWFHDWDRLPSGIQASISSKRLVMVKPIRGEDGQIEKVVRLIDNAVVWHHQELSQKPDLEGEAALSNHGDDSDDSDG